MGDKAQDHQEGSQLLWDRDKGCVCGTVWDGEDDASLPCLLELSLWLGLQVISLVKSLRVVQEPHILKWVSWIICDDFEFGVF